MSARACERHVVYAACDALGAMTDDDLATLARYGEDVRVRVAAALVLAGRESAVPPHPSAADFLAAHTYGGSR